MGNIFTACSSKKHTDKVDDFTNVSVHGNIKVVEEKVIKEDLDGEVKEKVVEQVVEKDVAQVVETTIEENKL
jgi:hypothetical protein